jgi:hypothetical protein
MYVSPKPSYQLVWTEMREMLGHHSLIHWSSWPWRNLGAILARFVAITHAWRSIRRSTMSEELGASVVLSSL